MGTPWLQGFILFWDSVCSERILFEFLKSRSHYYFLVGVVGFSMLMFFEFNNKALDIYALAGIVSGKEYWELIFNSFPVLLKTVWQFVFIFIYWNC
ncbi:MAG: hypothetical protein CM1200mP38_1340 [Dehalococcoidia bacterium]|nr:MAG: hypothetical protein CM1200mP38_1340 [Dehalococcoidia bacterium]